MKTGYRYVYAKPKEIPTLAMCMHRYMLQESKTLMGVVVDDAVGQINEELRKTALRGRVVAEDRGECGVAEWLRKALSKSLTGASIVTETTHEVSFCAFSDKERN